MMKGVSITGCTVTLIWEVLAAKMIFPPLQLEENAGRERNSRNLLIK